MVTATFYHLDKRPNSLKIPSQGGEEVEVKLKNETSKYSPSFYLSRVETTWNYLKFNNLYFYISDVITIRNGYYLITTTLDVLASYREQIKGTTAYVRYSTSNYDTMLPDDRLSVGSNITYQNKTWHVFDIYPIELNNQLDDKEGTYIVNYVTENPTLGCSGTLLLTYAQTKRLAEILAEPDFKEYLNYNVVGELVARKLDNIYDCVISCKYIPIKRTSLGFGSKTLYLAGYDTHISGVIPYTHLGLDHWVEIPHQFSDFRQLSPYSDYYIVLPGVGIIPYNANLLINRPNIHIFCDLDATSGDIMYVIDDTTRVSGNIASNMTLSSTSTPGIIGGIASAVTGIGALATGHVGVAAATLFGAAVSSSQVETGSTGGMATNLNIMATTDSIGLGDVGIVSVTRNTNIEPITMAEKLGRPCNKLLNLGTLSGYVQTVEASVNCEAPLDIKEQINSQLDGGVYFE